MQLGDAVAAGGQAQRHHGHVELRVVVLSSSGLVPMANSSSIVTPHSAAKPLKYFSMSARSKRSMPGRHRRVGREHAAGAHRLDRGGERQPGGDVLADPLQAEEPGVALVDVEHLRVDAEGPQRPHAADAEDDLLAQAVVRVAAVEAVGDRDAVGGVALDVGVEQVQRRLLPTSARQTRIVTVVAGEVDASLGHRCR